VRVAQPWAGKGWGSVNIPRIGNEVVVEFLEGDPDRPIVTGSVYNADQAPPFTLPSAGIQMGMKSRSSPGGGGFNEITMTDTKGKEMMNVHAQYDMVTKVEHDDTQTVVNDRTITVDGKHTETIKKDTTIKVTEGNLSHDVVAGTATHHVKGAVTESYEATQATTVKGDITIVSQTGGITVAADAKHIYIHAATSIHLHVGESMIWMDSGGQINIKGIDVAINGSGSVTIKGGIVHSEAQSQHQTKGAIVLSEGSATNTVKGGMVMLNP
jgi:type VI secretion system secreted protein VgrG